MDNHSHDIEWSVIARKISGGQLSPDEEAAFSRWLEADSSHAGYFNRARREWTDPQVQPDNDLDKLFSFIRRESGIEIPKQQNRKFRIYPGLWKWAAAAVVALGLGIYTLSLQQRVEIPETSPIAATETHVVDHTRAQLTLADGKTIELTADAEQTITDDNGETAASVENGNIVFDDSSRETASINTLEIPRGGEYSLQLSDGTRIWLNSRTKLRFPSSFDADNRTVWLEGEAYFEVAKDTDRQFRVITGNSEVRVYGTSFNVRAYSEYPQETTLASGSIGLEFNGQQYMLTPGQQARIEPGSEKIAILNVNPATYCSWHKGLFIFENATLATLLNQLSDWYCVDFVYTDPSLRNLHFTGDLERYSSIDEILSMISLTTNVKFTVDGRIITVRK